MSIFIIVDLCIAFPASQQLGLEPSDHRRDCLPKMEGTRSPCMNFGHKLQTSFCSAQTLGLELYFKYAPSNADHTHILSLHLCVLVLLVSYLQFGPNLSEVSLWKDVNYRRKSFMGSVVKAQTMFLSPLQCYPNV